MDKNDQLHKGQERLVAAATVVLPVWRLWKQMPAKGRLFLQKSGSPLLTVTLMKRIKGALKAVGVVDAHRYTAKCFRRGGASTLSGAGASGTQISVAGGWSLNATTYQSYLGPLQHRQRALAASRLMDSQQ